MIIVPGVCVVCVEVRDRRPDLGISLFDAPRFVPDRRAVSALWGTDVGLIVACAGADVLVLARTGLGWCFAAQLQAMS